MRRSVALNPQNADAFNNLGVAYKRLDRLEEAGQAFEESVRAGPRFVPALINLGLHYLNAGKLAEAEQKLAEALALQPNSPKIKRDLSRVRSLLGRK